LISISYNSLTIFFTIDKHVQQIITMSSIPKTQKAYILTQGIEKLSLEDRPVPELKPGEVLLRVRASGLCHSDLHILDGSISLSSLCSLPASPILGHEIAGEIVAHGPNVDPDLFPTGELYSVFGPNPCGLCSECRYGRDNLCLSPTRLIHGLGHAGGFEQYTAVNIRNLIKVPEGISPEVAAVTTDAVLTPYHALKKVFVTGLNRVLIIGLGGIGINAVQIAKAFGAHVTAFDLKESSRELARKFSADVVLDSLTVKEAPHFYDVVVDVVGIQSSFEIALKQVKPYGSIVLIGLGSPVLNFFTAPLCLKEIHILGTFWGTSQEQIEVFDLVKKGKIKPQVEVGKFEDLNEYFQKLKHGQIKSRIVITQTD
jgi:propanol-preferring alcohol dehydrogenase